jgi:hypothetical protein
MVEDRAMKLHGATAGRAADRTASISLMRTIDTA